jgi:hypothetical protein
MHATEKLCVLCVSVVKSSVIPKDQTQAWGARRDGCGWRFAVHRPAPAFTGMTGHAVRMVENSPLAANQPGKLEVGPGIELKAVGSTALVTKASGPGDHRGVVRCEAGARREKLPPIGQLEQKPLPQELVVRHPSPEGHRRAAAAFLRALRTRFRLKEAAAT